MASQREESLHNIEVLLMTSSPANSQSAFLSTTEVFPEDSEEFLIKITNVYASIANSTNLKEIGQYDLDELVTGQQWFTPGDPGTKRTPYRTVVNFGALPNIATKSVAHNLTDFASITFTRIYGISTIPGTTGLPLPFTNPAGIAESIALFVDATNVNVITGTNRTAFTETYVVLEYVRN